ncbi:MAG: RHS repeat-associated core domain-containing protein [Chitinophagales bacterium]|nr:RHS repeat-associated core domain-containing protein [Chitinophagales bacterium]
MAQDTTINATYTPQYFLPDVYAVQNYYAFGQNMPKWSSSALNDPKRYRFGYNGKEDDDEWNKQDYGFRIYDTRLARFLSVDPIRKSYESSFVGFANNPTMFIDPDGRDNVIYLLALRKANPKITSKLENRINELLQKANINATAHLVNDPGKFDITKIDPTDAVVVIGGNKKEAVDYTLKNLDKGYLSERFKNESLCKTCEFYTSPSWYNPEVGDGWSPEDWGYVTLTSTQVETERDLRGGENSVIKNFNFKNEVDAVSLISLHGVGHLAGSDIGHAYGNEDKGFMYPGDVLSSFIRLNGGDILKVMERTKNEFKKTIEIIQNRFPNDHIPKANYVPE